MRIRSILAVTIVAAAMFASAACGDDNDNPPVVTPTVHDSAVVTPKASVVATPTTTVVPTTTTTAVPATPSAPVISDEGLQVCNDITKNVQAQKLPLPTNESDAYYDALRKKFQQSKYEDVTKAGDEFIDKYESAVKPGGVQPDANDLSDAATDLLKACASHE